MTPYDYSMDTVAVGVVVTVVGVVVIRSVIVVVSV